MTGRIGPAAGEAESHRITTSPRRSGIFGGRPDRHRCKRLVLLVAAAACPLAFAQSGNPFEGNPEAIDAGGPLFAARCAECHGPDAKGVRGPDLTGLWARGRTDDDAFATIRSGVEGTIMPPSQAPDDEIWAVLAWLRSIGTVPPFTVPGADETRGRMLFDDKCRRCHIVDGDGGALGPNLSRIALSRSREALERAIRDPDETVASGYRTVSLITADGVHVEGIVKREDTFSLQIIDTDQRLQGYAKNALEKLEFETGSMMPRFGRRDLDRQDLDDVLAYLSTLRGD